MNVRRIYVRFSPGSQIQGNETTPWVPFIRVHTCLPVLVYVDFKRDRTRTDCQSHDAAEFVLAQDCAEVGV